MLTGRYQNRYGFDSQPMTRYAQNRFEFFVYHQFIDTDPMVTIRNDSIPRPSHMERQGLPPSEITMAEALGATGYQTAVVGKWHLGYQPPWLPPDQGFDLFRGLSSGDGDFHTHVDRSGNLALQVTSANDAINETVFQQEFARLKALGQFDANGRLDRSWSGRSPSGVDRDACASDCLCAPARRDPS